MNTFGFLRAAVRHPLSPRRGLGHRRAESGTTLIEALVAMLVLSVGLLGIAGLASASLRYAQGSWARAAVASNLSDLADRVRANPAAGVTAYAFAATSYEDQREAFADGDLEIARDCLAVGCTAAQLATFHMAEVRNAINRSMPGGALWVSGERGEGYVATVMWFDKTYLDDEGDALEAPTCTEDAVTGEITDEGILARNCCPADAEAPEGVRCTTMTIVP